MQVKSCEKVGKLKSKRNLQNFERRHPNIEAQDDEGLTALMHASKAGSRRIVELLLENNARVEVKDHLGRSALKHEMTSRERSVYWMFL